MRSATTLAVCLWVAAALGCGSGPAARSEDADCGTVLAAGFLFGDRLPDGRFDGVTPVVLRLEKGGWRRSVLPADVGGGTLRSLYGVSIAQDDPRHAWSWGVNTVAPGFVALRSVDGGRTWMDVADRLPAEVRTQTLRLLDLQFLGETAGWLATGHLFLIGPPTIYVTTDLGATWQSVQPHSDLIASAWARFSTRDGEPEVALSGGGTRVLRLGGGLAARIDDFNGSGFATASKRGWISGTIISEPTYRPAVYSGETDGTWTRQQLPFDGFGALNAIDFADTLSGVTCGRRSDRDGDAPLCFWTQDGGATWQASALPEIGAAQVFDVVRCAGSTAWAIAERRDDSRVAFLHSADAGATWAEVPVPGIASGQIRAMARGVAE